MGILSHCEDIFSIVTFDKWENISRQYVNHPREDEIFSPLCLIQTWFSNPISKNIYQLFKLCAFIHFWYRVFFLYQRENNRSHPLMEGSHIGGKYSPMQQCRVIWILVSRFPWEDGIFIFSDVSCWKTFKNFQ